jgi:hypothetical protein
MYHLFAMEQEIQTRHQEALRRAEKHRLLRHVRPVRRRRLCPNARRVTHALGHLLVLLGQQLQQLGQPHTILLEGQINGNVTSVNDKASGSRHHNGDEPGAFLTL